jgi:drug/metabolite transporter (DMT)-like permease
LTARVYPLGEVLFVRGLMAITVVGAVLIWLGHLRDLRLGSNRIVFARSGLEAMAALLFTSALVHMPLAALSTILLISPLIITFLSIIFYGEQVRWRRWTAIIVGFAGTLFVVKPTPSAFDAWALLGILCAFVSASRDMLTRQLDPVIPSIVVSFLAAVSVTVAGLMLGLTETWRMMAMSDLGLLAIAAVLLAAGNFLIVLAFRDVEMSVVAPFRYSILLWAGLAGYFMFGELPDRWGVIGAMLIVASGLYTLHRETVRAREATSRAAASKAAASVPRQTID